jgi:WD40 repeat protein
MTPFPKSKFSVVGGRPQAAALRMSCPLCCSPIDPAELFGDRVITCGECQLRFSPESVGVDARHHDSRHSDTRHSGPRLVEPVPPTRIRRAGEPVNDHATQWLAEPRLAEFAPAPVTPPPLPRSAAPIRNLLGKGYRPSFALAASLMLVVGAALASGIMAWRVSDTLWVAQERIVAADERCEQTVAERNDAERRVRQAVATRLSEESQELLPEAPQRSIALASEAVTMAMEADEPPAPAAEQSLRDALLTLDDRPLAGHTDRISSVIVSANGRLLVTASYDGTARLWDLTAKYPAAAPIVLAGHEGRLSAVAMSPDGRWLATGSYDGTVRLWDLNAKNPATAVSILRGHEGRITAVTISANGRWLVSTGGGFTPKHNTARVWDLTAADPGTSARVLVGHEESIQAATISPDSRWLVTGSFDRTARVWDLEAVDPSSTAIVLTGHTEPVQSVAIAPSRRLVITGSFDATARIWNLAAADPSRESVVLNGHRGWIRAVAISPDGHWAVTGGEDKTARVWDLTAADPSANSHVLEGHTASIQTLAITPDGRRLVTGSLDQTARIWDLTNPAVASWPIILRGHNGAVQCLAVSSDNHWLVTAGDDRTARLWNLRLDELSTFAREVSHGDPFIDRLRRCFLEPVTGGPIRR